MFRSEQQRLEISTMLQDVRDCGYLFDGEIDMSMIRFYQSGLRKATNAELKKIPDMMAAKYKYNKVPKPATFMEWILTDRKEHEFNDETKAAGLDLAGWMFWNDKDGRPFGWHRGLRIDGNPVPPPPPEVLNRPKPLPRPRAESRALIKKALSKMMKR